jgi:hypothetical protein
MPPDTEHRYKLGVLRYGTKNTGTSSVYSATAQRTPVQARCTPLRHKEHRYKLSVLRYGTKNTGTSSLYFAAAQITPVQARCTPLRHKEHRYKLGVLRQELHQRSHLQPLHVHFYSSDSCCHIPSTVKSDKKEDDLSTMLTVTELSKARHIYDHGTHTRAHTHTHTTLTHHFKSLQAWVKRPGREVHQLLHPVPTLRMCGAVTPPPLYDYLYLHRILPMLSNQREII